MNTLVALQTSDVSTLVALQVSDVTTLVALQISVIYLVSSHTRRGISERDVNKCYANSF